MTAQRLHKDPGGRAHLADLEQNLRKRGQRYIIGVDESGRGPLAGPVVAAAVILPEQYDLPELADSKKLTAARREVLFEQIVTSDAMYAVGIADNDMIDSLNILRASLRAMARAVAKLRKMVEPDVVLVDGNMTIPSVNIPQIAIVGGDDLCPSISAASILAKVTRDRIMDHYAKLYPQYAFQCHRGYCTALHLKELKANGPTAIHRKSFRPVQEMIEQVELELAP